MNGGAAKWLVAACLLSVVGCQCQDDSAFRVVGLELADDAPRLHLEVALTKHGAVRLQFRRDTNAESRKILQEVIRYLNQDGALHLSGAKELDVKFYGSVIDYLRGKAPIGQATFQIERAESNNSPPAPDKIF